MLCRVSHFFILQEIVRPSLSAPIAVLSDDLAQSHEGGMGEPAQQRELFLRKLYVYRAAEDPLSEAGPVGEGIAARGETDYFLLYFSFNHNPYK